MTRETDALATAAESAASAITQMVRAAVAEALAAHCCGAGEQAAPRPALLTHAQVLQQLGISRATLYKLLRDGDIRNVALGSHIRRIPATELDRYIAGLVSRRASAGSP